MTVSRLLFQRIGYKRLPPRVNHFASEAPNGRDERRRTLITARRVGYQGSTQLHPVVRKALRAERIHGGSKAYPGRGGGAGRPGGPAKLTGVCCLRVRCSDLLAGQITDLTVHSEGLEGAPR
jgi:hypothetical protein